VAAHPRVSVVIPLFNLRRFVDQAIESVLSQTLPADAVEVVVVDDGSTDGSGEVVRRYGPPVRYIRQENRGLPAARNTGIRESSAPFLTFLDADDRLLPEKLAAQLATFDARSDVGLVSTGVRYVDDDGAPLPQHGWSRLEGDVLPRLVLSNLVHPHLPLVRRRDVERLGGFDEDLSPAADWDMWLRLTRSGLRWAVVDRPLAEYRIRHDAMHQDVTGMADDCLRVLDKLFADPDLPDAIRRLRPLAYQRQQLVAACDHYRVGNPAAGLRWLHAAAISEPAFLTDPHALRQLCRWLLPLGYQRGTVLVAELPHLARTIRGALTDLFALPSLEPEIARLRRRSSIALWLAVAPLVRKRAKAALRRGWARLRPGSGTSTPA